MHFKSTIEFITQWRRDRDSYGTQIANCAEFGFVFGEPKKMQSQMQSHCRRMP
jgi:hypothetical protein